MTDINPEARDRREKARVNGRFGDQVHTDPEVTLVTPTPKPLTARERREARIRARAGNGPFADVIASIRGQEVAVPTRTTDGRVIVGEGDSDRFTTSIMDGQRKVVFDDGTTGAVAEEDIVRDLPPVPAAGDPVTIDEKEVRDLRAGDVILELGDNGSEYRQILTCSQYMSTADLTQKMEVVFTDAPDRPATWGKLSVPVEVVRPARA